MRLLEDRRHSHRDPTSTHISRAGIELARRVAPTIGPFHRVVTSPKPRAVETAVALGWAVDAELDGLGLMPEAVSRSVDELHPKSFADYIALTARSSAIADYARTQERLWRSELEGLPDGGRLLFISHGGIIELGAAAALPESARSWGPAVGLLEGIRLYWNRGRWVRGEVLRVGP